MPLKLSAKKLFEMAPLRLVLAALVALLLTVPLVRAEARAEQRDEAPVRDFHSRDPHFIYELKFGLLGHDQNTLLNQHRREKHIGLDFNADVTFAAAYHVPYFGGVIRPAMGGTLSAIGTNLAYVDARYRIDGPFSYYLPREVFVMVGLGGAFHNGNEKFEASDRKAFGSRVLFHVPVEIGWQFNHHHSIALYYEHIGNAGLAAVNEGMANLGVRWGYRF
jgi:lipid A 3-O-deacylase